MVAWLHKSGGGRALTVAGWSLVEPRDQLPKLFMKPDDFFDLSDVADRSHEVSEALADCLSALDRQRSEANTDAGMDPLPEVLVDEGSNRR